MEIKGNTTAASWGSAANQPTPQQWGNSSPQQQPSQQSTQSTTQGLLQQQQRQSNDQIQSANKGNLPYIHAHFLSYEYF